MQRKKILVTGGASFIGSHLVDALLRDGATVTVVDDLSSGQIENLQYALSKKSEWSWEADSLLVVEGDIRDPNLLRSVVPGNQVVFHLAAIHGGRGFIDSHPADCCQNMAIDMMLFDACRQYDVDRVCFASSACVYPQFLQEKAGSSYLLKESDADPFQRDKANADLEYGWTKLMGEMALRAYHRQYGMKVSSVRIFTAYGPRENETHAIIALIARAFVHSDPFLIWGTGEQDRNFTYVQDIVDAMILASERIEDGSAVNAGRSDRLTINQAAELVFELIKWRPKKIIHDITKPQGVASRAADLTQARELLAWEPKISYREGFTRTIDWYVQTHEQTAIASKLNELLIERKA